MKKVDRLLIKSFLGPFILTFFVALFVLIIQFLWKYIDDLVGKGLELPILLELVFYLSLTLIPLAIPISVLLASIITFGDLGEHYELVALKSAGVPLTRFMIPIFAVALLLSCASFGFANKILPLSYLKFGTLLQSIVKQRPALNIKPGVIYDEIEGFRIKIGSKAADNQTLYDVIIWDQNASKPGQDLLVAKKGKMFTAQNDSLLVFTLYNGWKYRELPAVTVEKRKSYEQLRTYFAVYEKAVDVSIFGFERKDENVYSKNPKTLSISGLNTSIDSLRTIIGGLPEKLIGKYQFYLVNKDNDFKENKDSVKLASVKQSIEGIESANEAIKDTSTLELGKQSTSINDSIRAKLIGPNWKYDSLMDDLGMPYSLKRKLGDKTKDNIKNLRAQIIASNKKEKYYLKQTNVSWYYIFDKFSLAGSCIILYLIGAALGAIIRKGGLGLPMVLAIVLFVIYYMLMTIGKGLMREDILPAFYGSFFPIFLLLPIAVFLVIKASNDSMTFSIGTPAFIGKLMNKFKRT